MKFFKLLLAVVLMGVCVPSLGTGYLGDILTNPKAKTRLERKAEKAAKTARIVDSIITAHSFTFVAQQAVTSIPSMPYIALTGIFSFTIDSAKVTSYLPFYGNMYQVPINASESPLSFTSPDFQYEVRGAAKGREKAYIEINVIVQGVSYNITIEVFDTATAVMAIGMSNGSTSTFYGYIEPTKPKE